MKKTAYFKGIAGGFFLNISETFALALVKRKPRASVILEKRVAYGDGPRETGYLMYKKDGSEKRPLLIYIHGGGWVSGLPSLRNTYCLEYAERGFFAANIGYEYSPQQKFPYQIRQIFKAIDWIFDNADKYNIDTERIVLAGESAGGYFVDYIGGMMADKSLFEKLGIEFRNLERFRISAIVCICGAIEISTLIDSKFPGIRYMLNAYTGLHHTELRSRRDEDSIKLLSPSIKEGFPPAMIVCAKHDPLRSESYELAEKLKKLNIPFKIFEGTGLISLHAWAIASFLKQAKLCLEETLSFIGPYIEK